ncbi:MAG: phosphatase PAP2 family protein [Bergeyella sp.]|nr:phosphatase PAP2 family protein [Bergeyella sp.]
MCDIIDLDKSFLVYLNGLGSEGCDGFWILVSKVEFWVPLYVILTYLLYKSFSLYDFLLILLFLVLGVTVSDQLANFFKLGIGRLRPCHDPAVQNDIRKVVCGGLYSFYSGHASNTFFIAGFLSFLLKNKIRYLSVGLFFWAVLVSYSRIYLGVHFPLDVMMGGSMGFFLSGLFSTLAVRTISQSSSL